MKTPELLDSGPGTSAAAFLGDLYGLLQGALEQAASALAGTAGMGGHVTAFTGPYDATAAKVFGAGCDLAGAVSQLQLMVMTTFDNYRRAEGSAEIDRVGGHMHFLPRPAAAPYPFVPAPPSAAGDNGGEPWIWHVITALRPSAQWPDVATGTVRRAAGAWSILAAAYEGAATYLDCAIAELDSYRAPELPAACAVLERLGRQSTAYADQCSSLAATLSSFADTADSALARLHHICGQAEIEAGAGTAVAVIAGVLTFGVGGAGGEGALNAALAGTVGMTIADLTTDFLTTTAALCESFQVIEPVAEASTALAGGILEARIVRASVDSVGSAAAVGGGLAATGAPKYRLTLARLERLEETTNTHVIERHVGRTLEQLEERFHADDKLKWSSSFYDDETALECINDALRAHETELQSWLASSPGEGIAIEGTGAQDVGIVMSPAGKVTPTRHYRLFFVPDLHQPEGFRILTGYPKIR